MTTEEQQLVERLRAACVGHPHAKIAWPHRLLHEAADTITRLVEEAAAPPVGALKAIADIREVTGLGAKPMLTELATAVKTLLSRYAFERDEARQQLAASEAKVAELQEALTRMTRRFELYAGPNDMHAGHHDLELLTAARRALEASK